MKNLNIERISVKPRLTEIGFDCDGEYVYSIFRHDDKVPETLAWALSKQGHESLLTKQNGKYYL